MDLQLRLATMADVPAIQKLIQESVAGLSREFYTTTQIASGLSHLFGVDTQLIQDQTYFIALGENELAGSGGWSKRNTLFGGDHWKGKQIDALLDPKVDAARIRAFFVNPLWARRGVATAILDACETAAKADGFSRVELVATMPGVPFYLAKGYHEFDCMTLDTPDGESLPARRMMKVF
jgi:N-acetylglutamate synthase-like GNAT family acetyltransferase